MTDYIFNQAGFMPKSSKFFIVKNAPADFFEICNFITKKSIFEGNLRKLKHCELSGENDLSRGDFSKIHSEGIYYIRCAFKESEPFKIERHIYEDMFASSLKTFYFQRASMKLAKEYADEWARNAGHPDIRLALHESTGKIGFWSAPGGWYDAGDYGKYVVNAGITLWTLLTLHHVSLSARKIKLNIPESKNGICDLLNEIRYELEWLLKMQDEDGGVFFKVGSLKWTGHFAPAQDALPRYVIGKSTASTLNFVIACAFAARSFKSIDADFSSKLWKAAEKAWEWAVNNPEIPHPAECGGTGLYPDDNFSDEFISAAVELYVSSGSAEYQDYVLRYFTLKKKLSLCCWNNFEMPAVISILTNDSMFQKSGVKKIKREFMRFADEIKNETVKAHYRVPMKQNDFIWGSNSIALNKALVLCFAHKFSGKKTYLNATFDILNYICGMNPLDICYVTGFGKKSPRYIHYRPFTGSDFSEPHPGFLAGGPNNGREDDLDYPLKFPMTSYLDRTDSFASNEVAINWNAVLAFVLGYIDDAGE